MYTSCGTGDYSSANPPKSYPRLPGGARLRWLGYGSSLPERGVSPYKSWVGSCHPRISSSAWPRRAQASNISLCTPFPPQDGAEGGRHWRLGGQRRHLPAARGWRAQLSTKAPTSNLLAPRLQGRAHSSSGSPRQHPYFCDVIGGEGIYPQQQGIIMFSICGKIRLRLRCRCCSRAETLGLSWLLRWWQRRRWWCC